MLVHMIDLMDSKMHSFEAVKRTDNNIGHWSGYVRHLDRIVFKDELPYHTEYVEPTERNSKPQHKNKVADKKPIDKKPKQEAKGAMADALKGFKV